MMFESTNGGNEVLEGDGFFISYHPTPGVGISFFESDDGSDETALVKEDSDIKYRILNGDYRKEYEELIPQGFEACLAFYEKMCVEHDSSWTGR